MIIIVIPDLIKSMGLLKALNTKHVGNLYNYN